MDRSVSHSRECKNLSFEELLLQAGVVRRGSGRGTCPDCHGKYTVSIDFKKEKFKCWNVYDGRECGFRGGDEVLKRRLGLYERLPPHEYALKMKQIKRDREQAAAKEQSNRELSIMMRSRLRQYDRMEMKAHERGAELMRRGREPGRVQWDALDIVYRKRDQISEALDQIDGRKG